MTTTAVTPTAAEITAAIDTLRLVPTVGDQTTLGTIEKLTSPVYRLAAALDPEELDRMTTMRVAEELAAIAARLGLRITTDPEPEPEPDEIIGHYVVAPDDMNTGAWVAEHRRPSTLTNVRDCVRERSDRRAAVLVLLPEGGKA